MTRTIDVQEAQIQFRDLLSLAQSGTEVVITEDAQPVARLVAVSTGRRVAGLNRGQLRAGEDFDEPLPDAFWTGMA